jgi:hypothetical protein
MTIIVPGGLYYHTSYTPVRVVDLTRCKRGSDFGRGFYVTSSRQQAERFVNAAIRKSRRDLDHGSITTYRLAGTTGVDCLEFATADAEWLHCVCAHRRGFATAMARWDGHDILAGKVANDDTNATIAVYLAGGYGDVGSPDAVATALRLLKPDVLADQMCLRTPAAVECLEYVAAEEVARRDPAA